MSRSYAKKYRMCNSISFFKRCANKKVRRTKGIQNGSSYKRLYCNWNINDGGRAIPIETNENELDRYDSWYREWMKKMGRK